MRSPDLLFGVLVAAGHEPGELASEHGKRLRNRAHRLAWHGDQHRASPRYHRSVARLPGQSRALPEYAAAVEHRELGLAAAVEPLADPHAALEHHEQEVVRRALRTDHLTW